MMMSAMKRGGDDHGHCRLPTACAQATLTAWGTVATTGGSSYRCRTRMQRTTSRTRTATRCMTAYSGVGGTTTSTKSAEACGHMCVEKLTLPYLSITVQSHARDFAAYDSLPQACRVPAATLRLLQSRTNGHVKVGRDEEM